jgi:hypothetical protein
MKTTLTSDLVFEFDLFMTGPLSVPATLQLLKFRPRPPIEK